MKPTRIRDLVLAALAATAISVILVYQLYGQLPSFPWYAGSWLAVLGAVEWWYARQVRASIRQEPGARPIQPLVAARALVLAKASSIFAALMAGLWAGVLIYTLPQLDFLSAAAGDATAAGIGLVAALALAAGALWLEYCCRAPEPPDDDTDFDAAA